MQRLVILSAAALLAALCAAAVWSAGSEPGVACDVAGNPLMPAKTGNPEPGIYAAEPNSMLVLVPRPVDVAMAVNQDGASCKMPVMKPENWLEKRSGATP